MWAKDEPFVGSITLNVYLTLHQNTLIYAIRGIGRGFSHYLLCSRELLLHLDPNYSYDIPHGRGRVLGWSSHSPRRCHGTVTRPGWTRTVARRTSVQRT